MIHTLTSLLVQLHHDAVLQWFLILAPLGIAADILTGIVDAFKHHSFQWRILADFAGQDLLKYGAIVLSALLAMISGVSLNVALAGEKTALVLLIAAVLTSVCTHLQDITGWPIVFWQNLLTKNIEQDLGIPVPAAADSVPTPTA